MAGEDEQAFEEEVLPARPEIRREWCEFVALNPLVRRVQTNGRIQCWGLVADVDKYLRVVILEDGETIHTAFFDRDFARRYKP